MKQNQSVKTGGIFTIHHYREGKEIGKILSPNLVPSEGLDFFLNSTIRGGSQISSWYVSLFKSNTTPQAGNTCAEFYGTDGHTELTEFTEVTRQAWNHEAPAAGDPSGRMSTNANSTLATFTVDTLGGATTIYGATISSSTLDANDAAGTLLAATRFASSRLILEGDVLKVEYSITATST